MQVDRVTGLPDSTLRVVGLKLKKHDLYNCVYYCAIYSPYVINIHLGSNNIDNDGVLVLIDCEGLGTITGQINLTNNNIGFKGAISIAKALSFTWVCNSLCLAFNKIGDIGVRAIAKALIKNTTLKTLSICNNSCSFDALNFLIDTIIEHNTSLITLYFYNDSLEGYQFNIIRYRFSAHRSNVEKKQFLMAFMLCVETFVPNINTLITFYINTFFDTFFKMYLSN